MKHTRSAVAALTLSLLTVAAVANTAVADDPPLTRTPVFDPTRRIVNEPLFENSAHVTGTAHMRRTVGWPGSCDAPFSGDVVLSYRPGKNVLTGAIATAADCATTRMTVTVVVNVTVTARGGDVSVSATGRTTDYDYSGEGIGRALQFHGSDLVTGVQIDNRSRPHHIDLSDTFDATISIDYDLELASRQL